MCYTGGEKNSQGTCRKWKAGKVWPVRCYWTTTSIIHRQTSQWWGISGAAVQEHLEGPMLPGVRDINPTQGENLLPTKSTCMWWAYMCMYMCECAHAHTGVKDKKKQLRYFRLVQDCAVKNKKDVGRAGTHFNEYSNDHPHCCWVLA